MFSFITRKKVSYVTDVFFNQPLELAKDALQAQGYFVIGGYMSPVNDAYRKKVNYFFKYFIIFVISKNLLIVDSCYTNVLGIKNKGAIF